VPASSQSAISLPIGRRGVDRPLDVHASKVQDGAGYDGFPYRSSCARGASPSRPALALARPPVDVRIDLDLADFGKGRLRTAVARVAVSRRPAVRVPLLYVLVLPAVGAGGALRSA
jgi:hypothetical protein